MNKMLTLKQKMKCHFMKQDDYISEGSTQHSAFSFLFFTNKFLLFFVSKMSVEESLAESCKDNLDRNYKS